MSAISNSELRVLLQKYKEDFYTENTKNSFFKKKQKLELARQITAKFDIRDLLGHTAYIINESSHIMFDYTVFKMFANELNIETVAYHVVGLFDQSIAKYGTFSVHVNLDTMTVSGAERYKKVVEIANAICLKNTYYPYTQKLANCYLYYPPAVLDMVGTVFRAILDPLVFQKMVIIPKKESAEVLNKILGNGNTVYVENPSASNEEDEECASGSVAAST